MAVDSETLLKRIDELERRLESLEHRLITRDVLDDEIRSLERRLREILRVRLLLHGQQGLASLRHVDRIHLALGKTE
jgi:hypothetical protein